MYTRWMLSWVVVALVCGSAAAEHPPEMKALLTKAIDAHGGAEKLNKFKANTQKMKGTVVIMNQKTDFSGEASYQMPDKMKIEMTVNIGGMNFQIVQVLNKDKGWISANNMTMEMPEEVLKEEREGLYAHSVVGQLTPLKDDKVFKLSPVGEVKVNGQEAVGMRVSSKGQRDINLYFDKKSGLMVKLESRVKDFEAGGKEVTSEIVLSKYKNVQDMPTPHKVVIHRDGKEFLVGDISEIRYLEKLADAVFAKP